MISQIRDSCVRARRILQRLRKSKTATRNSIEKARARYIYCRACLKKEIMKSKRHAWEDLLKELKKDPWGRPYQMVLGRLKQKPVPYTQTVNSERLNAVLDELFPRGCVQRKVVCNG